MCSSGLVCAGVCVASSDSSNCGACGRTCSQGMYCNLGVCRCSGFGLTACGESCVDVSVDSNHCGACGSPCRSGESCVSGTCRCPTGQTWCAQANGCVSLSNDIAHCGACGVACRAGEVCSSGTCRCPFSGHSWCASAGTCVDTLTSAAHCGSCDRTCRATEVCAGGTCICPSASQRYCASASACVDITSSSSHCGACDAACPASTSCASSACVCNQSGLTLCGTTCVDLSTNKSHCSACNNACSGNMVCTAGACMCPDPVGGSEVRLTTTPTMTIAPDAAWTGTSLGVTYSESYDGTYYNAYFAVLDPTGARLLPDKQLTSFSAGSNLGVLGVGVVWTGQELGVAWSQHTTSSRYDLVLQRFDSSGAPKAAPVVVNTSPDGFWSLSLGWSSAAGGYAIAWTSGYDLNFQLIGADGTNPGFVNTLAGLFFTSYGTRMAVAPDGSFGVVLLDTQSAILVVYNSDGSRTLPVSDLSAAGSIFGVDIAHDGITWVTAMLTGSGLSRGITINRGMQVNSPPTFHAASGAWGYPRLLATGDGTVLVGWPYRATSTVGHYAFFAQRFRVPSSPTSSAVTPVTTPVKIVAAETTTYAELAAGGSSHFYGLWADSRWGTERELYLRRMDTLACP